MPIFFKDFASKGIDTTISTSNWAFGFSLASFFIAILSPILGYIADQKQNKKRFLIFFLVEGIICTLAFFLITEGAWKFCLILYIMAKIGFAGADLFYNSLLIDITTRERMDWVSSNGFAWGYIGGVIPFLVSVTIILVAKNQSFSEVLIPLLAAKIIFVIIPCWWLILSLPLIVYIQEKKSIKSEQNYSKISLTNFVEEIRHIKKHKELFIFLIAYFFYINGVSTNINMATAYGREIGFGFVILILAILMIQLLAFPFVLLYGKLAEKLSTKFMLYIAIAIYSINTLLGFWLPVIINPQLKVIVFWLIAFLAATSMGGIQALSRSYFGKLIPKDNAGKFYGFYNLSRKSATIIGPFTMGIVARLTGHSRWGILSLLFFFGIGAILLTRVRESV